MTQELNTKISDSFADKALNALPKPVLIVFGVLIGLTIFLTMTGFNSALTRYANAYAARIERSVESLETVTSRIAANEKRIESLDTKVLHLDNRLTRLEAEHKK